MVKPPVVHIAGLLRRIGARRHDRRDWAWIGGLAGPAALLPAERRRLGRHALARHRDVPRPLDRRAARSSTTSELDPAKADGRRSTRRRVLKRALAFWNNPALTPATHRAAAPLRAARAARRAHGEVEAGAVPGARRERAPPADRRVPGPADRMSADRLRRVHARGRAARGRRAAGCRRSSRACRRPPAPA